MSKVWESEFWEQFDMFVSGPGQIPLRTTHGLSPHVYLDKLGYGVPLRDQRSATEVHRNAQQMYRI